MTAPREPNETGRRLADGPVRVLMVCTGNICRSPVAERLLAARVTAAGYTGRVEVSSAGTYAVVGAPVSGPSADLLRAQGVSADGFAARQVTAGDLAEADLVLGMTAEHRAAVVGLYPQALRYSFTLLELARLTAAAKVSWDTEAQSPQDRLAALLAAVPGARSRVERGADDISDPYGLGEEAYRAAYELIAPAVEALAEALTGHGGGAGVGDGAGGDRADDGAGASPAGRTTGRARWLRWRS